MSTFYTEIPKTFTRILNELNSRDIRYSIIGSIAAYSYLGRLERIPNDLDLVCLSEDLPLVDGVLRSEGFSQKRIEGEPEGTHVAYVKSSSHNHDDFYKIHVVVDRLLLLDDSYQKIETDYPLEEAIAHPIRIQIDNVFMHVPPIEDLVIMKMVFSLKESDAPKHFHDLSSLLRHPAIDIQYLKRKVVKSGSLFVRILRRRDYLIENLKAPQWLIEFLMSLELQTWNDVAEAYCHQRTHTAYSTLMETPSVMRMIRSASIKGKRALDAGCGGGLYMSKLQALGFDTIGSDISSRMLSIAKRKKTHKGNESTDLVAADSSLQCFRSEVFDLVVAGFLLDNVADFICTIEEFARILKKDGVLIVSLPHPFKTSMRTNVFKESGTVSEVEEAYDYFKQRQVVEEWDIGGKAARMIIHHRPLKDYLGPLFRFGFVIEDIDEPEPPKSFPRKVVQKRERVPTFIVFLARKVGSIKSKESLKDADRILS